MEDSKVTWWDKLRCFFLHSDELVIQRITAPDCVFILHRCSRCNKIMHMRLYDEMR